MLRNVARKLGVPRIFAWRQIRRTARYREEYRRSRPKLVRIGDHSWVGEFLADDEAEYVCLRRKNADIEILRAMADALPEGGVCWDVGANIGVYTVIAAQAVGPNGKVMAFEPEPNSRARLLQNVENNHLTNVEAASVALGVRDGTVTLHQVGGASSGMHHVVRNKESADFDRTVTVREVSGDAYRREMNLEVPAVIKIDVEGAEFDVIRGMVETLKDDACRLVVCEVHFAILHHQGQDDVPGQIVSFLQECGFGRVEWIDRGHLAAYKTSS